MKKKPSTRSPQVQRREINNLYRELRLEIKRLGIAVRAPQTERRLARLQASAELIVKTSGRIKKLIRHFPKQRNS